MFLKSGYIEQITVCGARVATTPVEIMHFLVMRHVFVAWFFFALNLNFTFAFTVERNLNPKAACLKRREEEKADEFVSSRSVASSEPVLHSSMVRAFIKFDIYMIFLINLRRIILRVK